MLNWFIQRIEAFSAQNGRYISNSNELIFIDRFANENDFSITLYEDGTVGLAQDNDQDDFDNNGNNNEDRDDPTIISLENSSYHVKIAGVPPPEHLVELPAVAPPEKTSGTPRIGTTIKRGRRGRYTSPLSKWIWQWQWFWWQGCRQLHTTLSTGHLT